MLKVGLVINPIAGVGGRVGLKGSDGEEIQQQALAMGAKPLAESRVRETLSALHDYKDRISWFVPSKQMGENALIEAGFEASEVVHQISDSK